MIYRLSFGDPSGNGHGCYSEIYVSCPDKKSIETAIKSIEDQYGKGFFQGFAHDYEEPFISHWVAEALSESSYDVERVFTLSGESPIYWPEIKCVEDLSVDANGEIFPLPIQIIIDMYIHLLNYHGARMTRIDNPIDTLDTNGVGYGCF